MKRFIIYYLIFMICATASASIFLNSFNSGRLSEDLKARHELDRTAMGSETLDNILIRPQGMAYKRPGTEFIDNEITEITFKTTTIEIVGEYPTLQVADGDFTVLAEDPGLAHSSAISDVDDLQAMADDLDGNYYLTGDIDASATATWNDGAGFNPIGNYDLTLNTEFAGTFDGCGYKISNLTINRPTEDRIGLFGAVSAWNATDVVIANVTLESCSFTGENYAVGGLIGEIGSTGLSKKTYLYNCHTSGSLAVTGSAGNDFAIGGMIGVISVEEGSECICYDCTSSCDIDTSGGTAGYDEIGGFIGYSTGGEFYNCRASGAILGNVSNDWYIGGFVGKADPVGIANPSIFQDCSATGNVSGEYYVGGFCGEAGAATFTRCSSRGDVTAPAGYGAGFIASASGDDCSCTDCYSWGAVTADYAGGFIQYSDDSVLINCYSIGVINSDNSGGFSQYGTHTITSCFWDTESSKKAISNGGVGHITSWMQTKANYEAAGWDFSSTWEMEITAIEGEPRYVQLDYINYYPSRLIPFVGTGDYSSAVVLGDKSISICRGN